MISWLAQNARRRPGGAALLWKGGRQTYGELADAVSRRAAVLAEKGVESGSRVGLQAENSVEWIRLAHAVFWLGGTLVPLDARLTADEVDRQIAEVEPDLVLTEDEFDGLVDRAEQRGEGIEPVRVPPSATATIFFTSGTTGRPKPVPLSWANHLWSAAGSAFNLGVESLDRWLVCLPLCHVGGLAIVLRSAIYGTAVDLMAKFDARAVVDRLESEPITHASFVPTMLRRVVEQGGNGSKSLRAVLVGGGPAGDSLVEAAREREIPALPTWGMTETASQFTTVPPGSAEESRGSVGPPILDGELRVADEEGRRRAAGGSGRIQVRGPMVFDGYLGRPELNTEVFADGWFDTGDVGWIDERGHLVVDARSSERITTGGETVDPVEVQRALRKHPSVVEACVVGVEDSEWGERIAAGIEVDRPAGNLESLDQYCRTELAAFKCPKHWEVFEQLPRTSAHKIDRHRVREHFESAENEE